jgi:LPXTG-motif cell wall-anchored protein
LTGTTKVVVAVIVPIIGVALIAIALLFFWKKRRRDRENSEMRRKEVEDYGFNPNSPPNAGGANSSNGDDAPYEMQEGSVGYRGWGSTGKTSNMGSTGVPSSVGTAQPLSPVGLVFPESTYDNGNGYTGVPTSPNTATFHVKTPPSDGGMSSAPLINNNLSGARPGTADSAVIAAITALQGPAAPDNRQDGIHRGISNASSNYSTATHSDQSDIGMPSGHYDTPYYGDGGYDDAHNYSGRYDDGHNYQQYPPPVIREVQARRNTQIETPPTTHFPQQGNSGIAQNF